MKSKITVIFILLMMASVLLCVFWLERRPRVSSRVELFKTAPSNEVAANEVVLDLPPENPYFIQMQKPAIPEAPAAEKKLNLNLGAEDVTPQAATVRATAANVGVDYKVAESHEVGIATGVTVYDRQDAKASNKSVEDEGSVEVKYKVAF